MTNEEIIVEYIEREHGYARLENITRFMHLMEDVPEETTKMLINNLVSDGKLIIGIKYIHIAEK